MILQALVGYYDRKHAEKPKAMPPFGYSVENIHFALVISKEGKFLQLQDLREPDEKGKPRSKKMVVPTTTNTSSRAGVNPPPNFLWDNTGYVLGAKEKAGDKEKYFEAFKSKAHEIGDGSDDVGMVAVLKFLDNWRFERISDFEDWEDVKGSNLVFQLDGELQFVHERPSVIRLWKDYLPTDEAEYNAIKDGPKKGEKVEQACSITGEVVQNARVHRQLSGVRGANSMGHGIVNFNASAYESYGLTQSFNAPVSIEAAFKYTTALNYLLSRDSGQNVQIGDATTVFWAGENSKVEDEFGVLIDPGGDPTPKIRGFLEAIRDGRLPDELKDDKDKQFFILGLSPNASRISVRFWYPSTVEDVFGKLGEHYARLKIEKQYDKDFEFPGLWWLLKETATLGKSDNIPPLLAGELMRSILTGSRYPESLLSAVLSRIRADGHTNYNRASLTKAILIKNHNKEVTVSLNKENVEVPYLLGRLFAVLERAQEDAAGGQLNATIKDKYFGSASATPKTVFPILLKLSAHHTKKGEHGGPNEFLKGQIIEDLPDEKFPASIPLEDQGLFFIGYYHQHNDFYKVECEKCEHRFSSSQALEKPDEKASKKDHKIVACPNCGASVEVKVKKEKKSDKTQPTEE